MKKVKIAVPILLIVGLVISSYTYVITRKTDLTIEKLELANKIADSYTGKEIKLTEHDKRIYEIGVRKELESFTDNFKLDLDSYKIYLKDYYNKYAEQEYREFKVTAPLSDGMTFNTESERNEYENKEYARLEKEHNERIKSYEQDVVKNNDIRIKKDSENGKDYILSKDVDLSDTKDIIEYRQSRVILTEFNAPMGYANTVRSPQYNFMFDSKNNVSSENDKYVDIYTFKSISNPKLKLYVTIETGNQTIRSFEYHTEITK